MTIVQDLGRIDGLDEYIEKRLAEKQKIIDEQQSTIEQLKEEIESLKQKEEVLNKIWRTYLENHE